MLAQHGEINLYWGDLSLRCHKGAQRAQGFHYGEDPFRLLRGEADLASFMGLSAKWSVSEKAVKGESCR